MSETQITYKQEVFRKLIHLSSLWIPLVMYQLDRHTALILFALLFAGMLATEIGRRTGGWFGQAFNLLFGAMLRQGEADKSKLLTGASNMMLGALICLFVFPKIIAVTSFCIMLVADSMAALIGRRWGVHPLFDKSVEGTFSFFITSLFVVWVLAVLLDAGYSFYVAGFAGSLAGTFAELYSNRFRVDDNLAIPLCSGAAMTVVVAILI